MTSPEVRIDLEGAVGEVLGLLTGLDLSYVPETDRFRSITRALNRALRANALDNEWSYYHSTSSVGTAGCGDPVVPLPSTLRPRIVNDDAVRLVGCEGCGSDCSCGGARVVRWAYFLPRDALHKYANLKGLWCSALDSMLVFSRPFTPEEQGLDIQVPVMREPIMFRLPGTGETVPSRILRQSLDFFYPDLTVARAAYFYAQTDPVMQPRVPTLEQDYKTLMYQLIERDTSHTDTPYQNAFTLPLSNGLVDDDSRHLHPHADFV